MICSQGLFKTVNDRHRRCETPVPAKFTKKDADSMNFMNFARFRMAIGDYRGSFSGSLISTSATAISTAPPASARLNVSP